MKSRLAAVVLLMLIGVRPNLAATNRELWVYGSGTFDLGVVWTGTVVAAARYSDALSGLSDRLVEVQAGRPLSSTWSLVPSFRLNHAQIGSDLRRREIQPGLALNWKGAASDWTIGIRARLEYRDFDVPGDTWRFRFRLRIMPPMPPGSSWSPYLSNETFQDDGVGLIDENRLFAGCVYRFGATWSADGFLGWRHRPNAFVLGNSIIVGVGGRLRF